MSTLARPATTPSAPPMRSRRHGPFSRRNLVATITTGYLPLLVATAIVVLPLLWMIVSSFKPPPQEILSQICGSSRPRPRSRTTAWL